MSEKEQIEHTIARQIDRLHELSDSAGHDLQGVIANADRLTVSQLSRLSAFARTLLELLEENSRCVGSMDGQGPVFDQTTTSRGR